MPEPCLKTSSPANPAEYASQIIDEYESFIRCVIRTQNSSEASEEDIFQDFYISLISKPVPDDVRSVKSYLYKAIIFDIADCHRRIRQYKEKIKIFRKKSDFGIHKTNPTSALIIKEEMNKMFEFIKEISPGRKYVAITLRYRDGYSIQEVADKMGIKNESVRKYISLVLRKVRKCLANS